MARISHGSTLDPSPLFREKIVDFFVLPCENRMCSTFNNSNKGLLVPTNKAHNCIVVILIRVSVMRCEKNFSCNTIVL